MSIFSKGPRKSMPRANNMQLCGPDGRILYSAGNDDKTFMNITFTAFHR